MVELRRTVNKKTVILLPHLYGTEICVMITGTRMRTQFIISQRNTTVKEKTNILLPHVYGTEICVMITRTRTRTQFIISQRSTKYGCIYV
jgi:hypothetical protein